MVKGVSSIGRNTCVSTEEAKKMAEQLMKNKKTIGIHPEHIVKTEEAARFTSPRAGINVQMPEGIEKLASKEAVNVYPGMPLN